MDLAAEFYWVVPAAVFFGTAYAVYSGYKQRGQHSGTIFNSAIIDSSVAEGIIKELARIATATEKIHRQMEKTAQTEDIRAVIANELRTELDKQKEK